MQNGGPVSLYLGCFVMLVNPCFAPIILGISSARVSIVYLSASVILLSEFPGKRLQDVTNVYSPSMFNFWPYLKARETELAEQRSQYMLSYLGRFYEAFEPIDRRLWASPDNSKQYAVATR
jgi:acyl-coenzyme A synthetase/AMP-(fatty) acid ligase